MKDSHPIVVAHDLCLGYEGKPEVVKGLSLQVFPNEIVGILGRNGSGKTTLIKALLGLLQPNAGQIKYYKASGEEAGRLEIGYVPQQATLDREFPISSLEVVASGVVKGERMHPRKQDYHAAQEILTRLGVAHLADRPIGKLSGGERQRVLLARAMVSHPDLLILDEPTTYVDEKFSTQLYELIPELKKESALIIVSHETERLVSLADQVIRL